MGYLRIRRDQFDALAEAVARYRVPALVERLAAPLWADLQSNRDAWPRCPKTDGAVPVGRFTRCIEEAVRRGLESPQAVRGYLELALAHGWDFERREDCSWIVERLDDFNVFDPAERVARALAEQRRRQLLEEQNLQRETEFLQRSASRGN